VAAGDGKAQLRVGVASEDCVTEALSPKPPSRTKSDAQSVAPDLCGTRAYPTKMIRTNEGDGMSLDRMTIELSGIGRVLKSHTIQVPAYQRSYKWERGNVEALFDDISNAIAERESEYFLGSIVASDAERDDGRLEVVDGQQRLATTTILIAAIRDHFFREGDRDRADMISTQYLFEKDIWSKEILPRLRLNDGDHDFFVKRVLSLSDSQERGVSPIRESHRAIALAADIAEERVRQTSALGNKPVERLRDLLTFLDDGARIILVTVPTHANAFVIFETLNDRGLDLAISDLLKNFLFLTAGDRISEVQKSWVSMYAVLEGAGMEKDTVDYIRHLWSSSHGATRENLLYSAIKKDIDSKQDAVDFALELDEQAKLYAAIQNPAHPFWRPLGPTARGHMETINLLRMVQIRPLVLAVLARFSDAEAKEALRRMVSWGVRFLIVGGLGGGSLERRYCDAAVKVRKGTIVRAEDLTRELADVVPSDSQFHASFAGATVSYSYLARYYLRVLERQELGEPQPELVANPNEEEVNLEHVLPRNPSGAWAHLNPEIASAFAIRIGNLALMQQRMNALVANDGFAEKRPHLTQSQFRLTAEIGACDNWGVEEIESRQRRLAELAVNAWPLA